MKNILKVLVLIFAFLGLVFNVDPAMAKPGKKGGSPTGFSKGKKKGWGESETPPGWSKGKKKGWGDEDTPPGLVGKNTDSDDADA